MGSKEFPEILISLDGFCGYTFRMDDPILYSLVAGLLASLACGLGALPLAIPHIDFKKHYGLGYAFAAGLMLAASVYNLIYPGLTMGGDDIVGLRQVLLVVTGLLLGSLFLSVLEKYFDEDRVDKGPLARLGTRKELLIFIAMAIHSIPEGIAVGVGYTSGEVYQTTIGTYIALAIGIHNIPEGLAVAIPLRSAGASIPKCFWAATLTSLPQPIAAVPAVVASWFFTPLMPLLMGFAAGAMLFLIITELIPEALEKEKVLPIGWAGMFGFCLMLLVQVII